MFGFGRKKDSEVVEFVCTKIRPLFGILAHRLGGLTPRLANDPYVLGYIIGAASIFAHIETSGKTTTELRGLVTASAIQAAFSSLNFTIHQASLAIQGIAGNPEAKRGANAADLIIGVGAGKTDRDSEPEIVAAKKAIAEMPESIKSMLGGNQNSLLLAELQEQLFFLPIEAKYGNK